MKLSPVFTSFLLISFIINAAPLFGQNASDVISVDASDDSDQNTSSREEDPSAGQAYQITASTTGSAAKGTYSNTFKVEMPAPIAGLPLPMSANAIQNAVMTESHITLGLRQNEALVLFTCLIDWPAGADKDDVTLAIPFIYNLPNPEKNSSSPVPVHLIPFSKAVKNIQVGNNEIKVNWKFKEGKHPNADAPSLKSVQDVDHWLVFDLKNIKTGTNVLTATFTIPYQQFVEGQLGKNAFSKLSSSKLDFMLSPALGWKTPLKQGTVSVFAEEMLPETLQIISPPSKDHIRQSAKGVLSWDIVEPGGHIPQKISIIAGPDISARASSPGMLGINNREQSIVHDYQIAGSSTLAHDPLGEPCSPEKLRTQRGFWAEGVPGDGIGEWLELTFPTPRKLSGILIEPGISPLVLGEKDPEAKRRPEIAFSLYSRPRTVKVIINEGEYDFKATLRDDWNVQMISIPYFNKPIRKVRLELDSVYPGSAADDTYITSLLPVSK